MISGVRSKFTLVSNYPKNAIAGVLRPDHSAAVIAGLFFHVSASHPIQISKLELSIRFMLREDGRSALDDTQPLVKFQSVLREDILLGCLNLE